MNNAFLKTRFRIFSALGLIPNSDSIYKKEKKIEQEYNTLIEFKQSDELSRYEDLRDYIRSNEFKKKKKEINARKYKGSEPYQKEKRFRNLQNTEPVKTYLKVSGSKELDHYLKMKDSSELKRFHELKDFFESDQFKEFKKSIEEKRKQKKKEYKDTLSRYRKLRNKYKWFFKFKDSQAYSEYLDLKDSEKVSRFNSPEEGMNRTDFEALKNDGQIKKYLKVHRSKTLKKYEALKDSEEIRQFQELEEYLNSDDFKQIPAEIEKLKLENTEEYNNLKEYKQLKKNTDVKKALKFKNSKRYSIYQSAVDSEALAEYQELKDYLDSNAFTEEKKYLKLRDKFKYSNEYQMLQEYKKLKKSDNIRWYYKHIDSGKYAFYRKWERTFLDDFNEKELDRSKWLTGYYWGKTLLNDSYVQAHDAHFFTDGSNLKLDEGFLRIITRQEEVEGKVWYPSFGFYPKKFSYTSGIINTGQSFRQKYGIFRARVKLSHARNLRHSFWLVPDKILPEVDVFQYGGKGKAKLELGSYAGDPRDTNNLKLFRTRIKGPNFNKKFYIFSLIWTPDELTWKINGIKVHHVKSKIPDEPMYMILNSGLDGDVDNSKLPKEMLIDWVEAYKEK